MRKRMRSPRVYMSGVNTDHATPIKDAYYKRGGVSKRMKDEHRVILDACIVEYLNQYEPENQGRRCSKQIGAMWLASNRIADDLGWNEYRKGEVPITHGVTSGF